MAARKAVAAASKKKVENAQQKITGNFLKGLGPDISEKDVTKILTMMSDSVEKEDPQTVRRVCETITRITETDSGFFALYRAGTMETLNAVLEHMEDVKLDVQMSYNAMVNQAAKWMSEVDHVDFFQLPQVLDIAKRFAGEYRSVALSTVATLDRFSMQQAVHRKAILQAEGLHLLHRILSAHRSVEFCQETLVLLFHVSDLPAEAIKPPLVAELSIIQTVVETLDQAPVNMRLQIAGLKLLALWQNLDDKRIEKAVQEANAPETFRKAIANLSEAGFAHAASWLESIGGAAFDIRAARVKGKKKAEEQEPDTPP